MEDEAEEAAEGAPAWMATFADLMSLLLTFFVLLLSFANVDIMKFEGMIGSMKEAFGVKYDDPGYHIALKDTMLQLFDKELVSDKTPARHDEQMLMGKVRRLVSRMQVAGSVSVLTGKDGLVVRVDGDLLFPPAEHALSPTSFAFLDEMAALLREAEVEYSVEGHSDSTAPGKSYASNFHLSSKRSLAVLEYMMGPGGLPPGRGRAVAYGDTRPLLPNDTPLRRSKNRRVEFVLHLPTARLPSAPR